MAGTTCLPGMWYKGILGSYLVIFRWFNCFKLHSKFINDVKIIEWNEGGLDWF